MNSITKDKKLFLLNICFINIQNQIKPKYRQFPIIFSSLFLNETFLTFLFVFLSNCDFFIFARKLNSIAQHRNAKIKNEIKGQPVFLALRVSTNENKNNKNLEIMTNTKNKISINTTFVLLFLIILCGIRVRHKYIKDLLDKTTYKQTLCLRRQYY